MKTSLELKNLVKEKYSEVAEGKSSCCSGVCCDELSNVMTDSYEGLKGYVAEADLGLGCGLPTQFAHINKGDTIIDLGSGAGNDCFVARAEAGETGKVIGIDMTEAMISKARRNAESLGYNNVEFRQGEIESMPVNDNVADVVVSNCVLNLVPDKQKAFAEIFRVMKPGGHFSISDIVLKGNLPAPLIADAEMYAGCVAGAIGMDEYMGIISRAGFVNVTVQKEKRIVLPDEVLSRYLSAGEAEQYLNSENGIFSVTVYAEKPKN